MNERAAYDERHGNEPCEHCGKVWLHGDCFTTRSRQIRCVDLTFAGPDDSSTSVDRELATGPSAGGDVRLPDPTPIFETAQRLAELVAIRDRAR